MRAVAIGDRSLYPLIDENLAEYIWRNLGVVIDFTVFLDLTPAFCQRDVLPLLQRQV